MLRNTILAGTALTLLAAAAAPAQAGGFALRTHSVYGLGSSFAGIAAPGASPSSMFWNPSAVTAFGPGLTSELNLNLIIPNTEINVRSASAPTATSAGPLTPATSPLAAAVAPLITAATGVTPIFGGQNLGTAGTDNTGSLSAIPATFSALNLGIFGLDDRISVGLVNTTPFGLVTKLDGDAATRFHGRTSELRVLNSSPTIGFEVSDMLSIGAGVQVSYADVRLTQSSLLGQTTPTPFGPVTFGVETLSEFEGSDLAFGFTLGATLRPTDTTTIGLGFRSSVSHELDGKAKITAPIDRSLGGIKADLNLPEIVTFGIRQDITPRFTALAGVEWTNWSRFDELRVRFDNPALPDSVTPQNYEDGWYFSLGGEFKATEALTLRTGLGYEITPVQDEFRTPRTPDTNRVYASIGASYEISDRFMVNAGYTHIFAEDGSINLTSPLEVASRGALVAESETSIDVIGVSLRMKLGGGSKPVADTYYK